jgi:uncharacterized protein (TIGR03437 family)
MSMRKSLFVSIGFLGVLLVSQAQAARIIDLDGKGVPDVEITATYGYFVSGGPCTGVTGPLSGTFTYKSDTDGTFDWLQGGISISPGIGCRITSSHRYTLQKAGYLFTRNTFIIGGAITPIPVDPTFYGTLETVYAMPTMTPQWAAFTATNYTRLLTSEMISAGFGAGLSTETASSTRLPLATTLGNRRVLVKDSAGVERNAKLIFVSPSQVNFITPSGMADGAAIIRILDATSNQVLKVGLSEVAFAAPGIFSANGTGQGPAAAQIVRVKPGNIQTYESIVQLDSATRRYVTAAIDFGPEDNQLFLVLYGSGFRQAARTDNVTVKLGGTDGTVTYAGSQPSLDGLDQINVRLPRTLIGRDEVDLVVTVAGPAANTLKVRFK